MIILFTLLKCLPLKTDCCRKFFNWDVIACLGGDEATPPGFYPDWSSIDESKVSKKICIDLNASMTCLTKISSIIYANEVLE